MSGLDLLIPQSALWYMLLVAVLIGAVLGVFCDGLFIIRLLLRDPEATGDSRRSVIHAILRGLFDALSVMLATILLMLLCYYTSDGQLRSPAVFGMALGFFCYRKTVSRIVRRIMIAVVGTICHALRFLWVRTVGQLIGVACRAIALRHRIAVTERHTQKLREDAAYGFGIADQKMQDEKKEDFHG